MPSNLALWGERLKRACRRQAARAPTSAVEIPIPRPDQLLEAYDRFISWEHQDTGELIQGVTPLQRRYFDRATCWRTGPAGRIAGRDLILKSRKLFITSFVMGLAILAMMIWPGLRFGIVVQKKRDSIALDLWSRMLAMIERLPSNWPRAVSKQAGEGYTLSNGSSCVIMTAGSGPKVAEKIGRSGTFHILLLTEPASYAYPEIVWAGAKGAVPEQSGWIVAEGTLPTDPDAWFFAEYRATIAGRGSFWSATFLPWYLDPSRVIPATSAQYAGVMAGDLGISPEDLEQERALNLTPGQRAWRRLNYCRGDHRSRRENRREYPETDEVPRIILTGEDITPYLDPGALAALRSMVRAPIISERLAADMVARIWDPSPVGVLISTDSAMPRSSTGDSSTIIALDPWTRDLVAEVSGRHAGAKLHYQAILWLLERLGCREISRHMIAPEANRARLYGLIDDYLLPDRTIRLYWEERRIATSGKVVTAQYPGYWLTNRNRPQLIQALVRWIEGEDIGPKAPRCLLSSAALIDELCHLIEWPDGAVRAAQGHHDDLAMALGGGFMISERIAWPRPGGRAPGPRPESIQGPRELPRNIRSRGRIIPA